MTEGIKHLTLSQQLSSVDGTKITSAFHSILDLLGILWIFSQPFHWFFTVNPQVARG